MKEHSDQQWKIQVLLEEKDFEHLTPNERQLVLSEMDEETYRISRRLILEAEHLLDESSEVQPAPLILPLATSAPRTGVYKALLAVSAAVIAFLLFFPLSERIVVQKEVEYLTQTDTVVERQYVYDTIFEIQTIERIKTVKEIVEVQVPTTPTLAVTTQEENRVLEAPTVVSLPELLEFGSPSTNRSAEHDPTSALLPDRVLNR